jgi:putative ABC transport system substrate-binding protein
MRRREFITLLGGAAAAWPLAARAEQRERMRRIGVLMGGAGNDPVDQARLAAFLDGLQQLGWIDGRNVRIDTRWPAGDADRNRTYAAQLVELAPDVIRSATTLRTVAWPPTGLIRSTSTSARPAMSIVSSRARSQPIFRCRRRPSISSSSI